MIFVRISASRMYRLVMCCPLKPQRSQYPSSETQMTRYIARAVIQLLRSRSVFTNYSVMEPGSCCRKPLPANITLIRNHPLSRRSQRSLSQHGTNLARLGRPSSGPSPLPTKNAVQNVLLWLCPASSRSCRCSDSVMENPKTWTLQLATFSTLDTCRWRELE